MNTRWNQTMSLAGGDKA